MLGWLREGCRSPDLPERPVTQKMIADIGYSQPAFAGQDEGVERRTELVGAIHFANSGARWLTKTRMDIDPIAAMIAPKLYK